MQSAIVLFAHGANHAQWAQPFERLRELMLGMLPNHEIQLAFLERMSPTLPEVVAQLVDNGCTHISVAPLFLGAGAHFQHDFPSLIDALHCQYPHIVLSSLPLLGDSDTVLQAIAEWLVVSVKPLP